MRAVVYLLSRRDLHPGERGVACVGKTKRGKGTKCMVLAGRQGIPLGVLLTSASSVEVTLAEATITQVAIPRKGPGRPRSKPERIVADRAYDSRALRERLGKRGIDLICPHLSNRKTKLQDGCKLRCYAHRWIVERTVCWIGGFRRLIVRHERHIFMFHAFVHLACALIALRRL